MGVVRRKSELVKKDGDMAQDRWSGMVENREVRDGKVKGEKAKKNKAMKKEEGSRTIYNSDHAPLQSRFSFVCLKRGMALVFARAVRGWPFIVALSNSGSGFRRGTGLISAGEGGIPAAQLTASRW
jgi:hypothetical protein